VLVAASTIKRECCYGCGPDVADDGRDKAVRMPTLYARCPNTQALISTGLNADFDTLDKLTEQNVAVLCDRCNMIHVIKIRDLFCSIGDNGDE
jgi:hypothetical protein